MKNQPTILSSIGKKLSKRSIHHMLFHLFFALSNHAHAVPLQITQQGKMIDPNGSAINGSHLVIFRIYTEETGGSLLWDETLTVQFNNGYYATVLGSDEVEILWILKPYLYPVYLDAV